MLNAVRSVIAYFLITAYILIVGPVALVIGGLLRWEGGMYALGHLGVRHIDMPATPQRVWQALRSASGAAPAGPAEPGDA